MGILDRLLGRKKGKSTEPVDYPSLVEKAMHHLRGLTSAHDAIWHLGEAAWSVDQGEGTIVFTTPRGIKATCPVQIIGTFNTDDGTWLWGWDHPSVSPPLAEHAKRLHEYGRMHGIDAFTTRKLKCGEDQCWEFTAIACLVCEAQGGYRGPTGTAMVFMTFGEPRLESVGMTTPGQETVMPLPAGFAEHIPDDVASTVRGFIQALYEWEVDAYETSEKNKAGRWMHSKETYAALIQRWCTDDVTPQPVSFGNDPRHHPQREVLLGAASTGDVCHVRTRHTNSTDFSAVYEYRLRKDDGGWRFTSLLYIDPDGDYECL